MNVEHPEPVSTMDFVHILSVLVDDIFILSRRAMVYNDRGKCTAAVPACRLRRKRFKASKRVEYQKNDVWQLHPIWWANGSNCARAIYMSVIPNGNLISTTTSPAPVAQRKGVMKRQTLDWDSLRERSLQPGGFGEDRVRLWSVSIPWMHTQADKV